MTATLAPSKAAKFADAAEALGWEVERLRLPEGGRRVRATRGDESYALVWHRSSNGNLVFAYGEYQANGDPPIEIHNVKAALRDMTLYRGANGKLLPFDLSTATPLAILEAVAGKHIAWRTSFGTVEEGDVPKGGMHLRVVESPRGLVLHFTDPLHTGFRSVLVSQIEKVS